VCEEVSSTGLLVSMDLVEVNPSIGSLGDVAGSNLFSLDIDD
jgi:arginase family enzyme